MEVLHAVRGGGGSCPSTDARSPRSPSSPRRELQDKAGRSAPPWVCSPDLAQIAEAVGCGWEGCKPLTEDGVNRLLDAILRLIVTDKQPLTFVANLATDFERLKFLSEQVAATCPASTSYYRDAEAAAPLPYSCHRLLTWLLERGYAISNIADCAAAGPDGYFGCELFRVSALSGADRDEILAEMDEFHQQQLELLDVGAATNQAITAAEDASDFQTVTRLKLQQALRAEFKLLLMLSRNMPADACCAQQELAASLVHDCMQTAGASGCLQWTATDIEKWRQSRQLPLDDAMSDYQLHA